MPWNGASPAYEEYEQKERAELRQKQTWTAAVDRAKNSGFSDRGFKFSDPNEGRSFAALLGKNFLSPGAYFNNGEYAVVEAGSNKVLPGYTKVADVNKDIHFPLFKGPKESSDAYGLVGLLPGERVGRGHPYDAYKSNTANLPKDQAFKDLQILKRTAPVASTAAPQASPSTSLAASQAVSAAQQDLNAARARAQDWLKKSGSTGTTARKFTGKFIDDANTMAASAEDQRQRLANDAAVWEAEGKLELAEKSAAFGNFLANAKIKAPEYKDPLTTPVKIDPNSIFAQQLEMLKGFDKA